MIVGAVLGLALIYTGTSRLTLEAVALRTQRSRSSPSSYLRAGGTAAASESSGSFVGPRCRRVVAIAVVISLGAQYARTSWSKRFVIQNPPMAPLSMNNEGDGVQGKFFPSSSQVAGDRKIPSKYFMESDACQRCHQDIFKEWNSSAHHFSSFNNQWYRKSVEYMQEVERGAAVKVVRRLPRSRRCSTAA